MTPYYRWESCCPECQGDLLEVTEDRAPVLLCCHCGWPLTRTTTRTRGLGALWLERLIAMVLDRRGRVAADHPAR